MEPSEWIPAWSDATGTGIPELDAEDRCINALVHGLNQAIADGRDREEIQRLSNQLLLEALSHFDHEERVLSERAYPLLKGHAALHRQMKAELEHAIDILRDTEARAMWSAYGLLVAQLFVEHMRQETMKYKKFLRPGSIAGPQGA